MKGKWAIEPTFTSVGDFHEGRAWATDSMSKNYGYIDPQDYWEIAPTIRPDIFGAADFSEGLVAVDNGKNRFGYMNRYGRWIIPPIYEGAGPFAEGLAWAASPKTHLYGIITNPIKK